MAEGGPARVGVGGALTEPPPTASGIGRFSPNKEGQSCRASVRVVPTANPARHQHWLSSTPGTPKQNTGRSSVYRQGSLGGYNSKHVAFQRKGRLGLLAVANSTRGGQKPLGCGFLLFWGTVSSSLPLRRCPGSRAELWAQPPVGLCPSPWTELPGGTRSPAREGSSPGRAPAALHQHPASHPRAASAWPFGSLHLRLAPTLLPDPPSSARSSRRQKWIPTCNGNVSHLCLLLDEGGGDGYPASRLDVGLEPLGHPGDPLTADGFPTAWPIPVPEPESNAPAVPVGEGDPASRLGSRPEPRGDGTDVPVGRTSPAPRLDAVLQPGWHRRGPPRAKDQAEGGKKSPEPSGVLRQMLEELERGHETEAMRATSTPGNCCPVVSRCHPSGSLCVSRLFPQCLLLHVTSAAKAESALGRGIWSTFRR
ncbi:uncharacterized protein M6G45_010214 [Spheniscus humboldti]